MSSNYKLQVEGGLKQGVEPLDIITRFEKIPTHIEPTSEEGSKYVAGQIAQTIIDNQQNNKHTVLALCSGKSPVGVYRALVELHKQGKLSFQDVIVTNIAEYYPINIDQKQSNAYTIKQELLQQVDVKPENIRLLDGSIPSSEISAYLKEFEKSLFELGGIDIVLMGIGSQGKIAMNEPGSHSTSRTRVVPISNNVRKGLSGMFYGIENTPTRAITMGIGTLMSAKRILIVGWGEDKSSIMARIIEGAEDSSLPATYLQEHPRTEITLDSDSASNLIRVNTPWLVGSCDWPERFVRKAVLWLCGKVNKPILKLSYQDYSDNYLSQMLDELSTTFDKVNIRVFNDLQHTISGWPGGKPGEDDTTRPARSKPFPKRIVIFSPHPDDDVISMGGTFLRLVDQGHDVHVGYQTSGNIAVHDDVVLQILDTARECGFEDQYEKVKEIIANKTKGVEPVELRRLKGSIRRAEAKAACRHFGVDDTTNVHFLNLPFYETGAEVKGSITQVDIDIVKNFLREVEPHQIYAAGDLSDPHGTHRICIEAVLGAIAQIRQEGDNWLNDCQMWLYRGAWQEWGLDMVDMAVPLSPGEEIKKRHAIYRHLSQKDIVPFPGSDKREFWQRAEDRTQATADLYNKLGMAEYQAIEVFVKYDILK